MPIGTSSVTAMQSNWGVSWGAGAMGITAIQLVVPHAAVMMLEDGWMPGSSRLSVWGWVGVRASYG